MAASSGHKAMMTFLLDKCGADPSVAVGIHGETAASWPAMRNLLRERGVGDADGKK
jgi:hypothetical protein